MAADEPWLRLRLTLKCTTSSTGSGSLKNVLLTVPGTTVEDLKREIEDKYEIPSCTQTLSWQGVTLRCGNTRLRDLGLRSGDSLEVLYHAAANCREILASIDWLSGILTEIASKGVPTTENRVRIGSLSVSTQDDYLEDLAYVRFHPWLSPEKYINKIFFLEKGGLDSLCTLLNLLQSVEWDILSLQGKFCLVRLLCILWNFGESFMLRKELIKRGVLAMCMRSLLEKPVESLSKFSDTNLLLMSAVPYNLRRRAKWLLIDSIVSSMGILCNLSEMDECKLDIATNSLALHQMVQVALCDTFCQYREQVLHCVVITFMSLANIEETHIYLAQAVYIEGLTSVPPKTSADERQQVLLEYDVLMFLVQLVIISSHLLPRSILSLIDAHLKSFLISADPQFLCEAEIENEEVWFKFLPYIRLLYHPRPPAGGVSDETYSRCLELAVISLQNMLSREVHRDALLHEDMLDYITCLPWHFDPRTEPTAHSRAMDLVATISRSEDVRLTVPSLLNASKASVAKNFCGLSAVVKKPVPELLTELC